MTSHITIVGTGLIGGSFALALRSAGYDGRITGCGRNEATLARAAERGIVDDYSTSLTSAVDGCDLVFLSVPMGAMEPVLAEISGSIGDDTIVTDAGSVKQSFIDAARRQLRSIANVVPAHPIAGTEHSGVEAGFAELYRDRRVILTPLPETAVSAINAVEQLWLLTGAIVERLQPRRHDEVFAATSHLPHLMAFGLVETLYRMEQQDEVLRYAAGGFSDFTRIASSDPIMWRDVCLHNRDALLTAMSSLKQGFATLERAIEEGDGATLESVFRIAKQTRDQHLENSALHSADKGADKNADKGAGNNTGDRHDLATVRDSDDTSAQEDIDK